LVFFALNGITADDQSDARNQPYRKRAMQYDCCAAATGPGLSAWIIVLIVVAITLSLILVAGALCLLFKPDKIDSTSNNSRD